MAILVTITDALLAFPIAYYMARVASPRAAEPAGRRGPDAALGGVPRQGLRLADHPPGQRLPGVDPQAARHRRARDSTSSRNAWLVFSYLWLPYMILPIYAGLERIPSSLLEASSDLGGRAGTTFRRVVLPLVVPGPRGRLDLHVLADARATTSRPTSSPTRSSSATSSTTTRASATCPLAAAYSLVPIVIMTVYLLVARRLGAFESL